MAKRMAWIGLLLWVVVPRAASSAVTEDNFSAFVTLTSDYVYRGLSLSDGEAAIQGGFDFQLDVGLFAGVWASSVDIAASVPGADPRSLELDYFAGYRFSMGPDWGGELLAVRFTYPGSEVPYDYTEFTGGVQYRDLASASVSYSDSVYGFDISAFAYDLTGTIPLPKEFLIGAGIGYLEFDSPFVNSYLYWNVGVSRAIGRFTLDLGYFDTDSAARESFGDLAGDRVVLTLTAAIQ